jgi:hypothetical protein
MTILVYTDKYKYGESSIFWCQYVNLTQSGSVTVENIYRDELINYIYIYIYTQFLSGLPLGILIFYYNLFELLFKSAAIQLLSNNYFLQNKVL